MNCASASGRIIARADALSLGEVVPVTRQLNNSGCPARFTQPG